MAGEKPKASCLHHPGPYRTMPLGSISNWFSLAYLSYFFIDNLIQIDVFVAKKSECILLKSMCMGVGFGVGSPSRTPQLLLGNQTGFFFKISNTLIALCPLQEQSSWGCQWQLLTIFCLVKKGRKSESIPPWRVMRKTHYEGCQCWIGKNHRNSARENNL